MLIDIGKAQVNKAALEFDDTPRYVKSSHCCDVTEYGAVGEACHQ